MQEKMIIVKNLFGDNRAPTVEGKEYIFKAYQERKVPETFLLPTGELRFNYLTLLGFVHDDGSVLSVDEQIRTKFEVKDEQIYVYRMIHSDTNHHYVSTDVKQLAINRQLEPKLLKSMYSSGKSKFKEYKIKKFTLEEYLEIDPDFKVG